MPISMHTMSVPVYARMLHSLSTWIDRAAAHAQEKNYDPAVLLASRLCPDMLPLSKQIQIACDAAKFGVARLTGDEAPKYEDNEATVDDFKARIARTIAWIESVPASRFEGREEAPVSVPVRNRDPLQYNGLGYLQQHGMPNFFFHVTTAYAILRHNGVPLGKADYLGH
jgi:hypothetical protein